MSHLNAKGLWAHAGDLGDLIYSLATMRQKGGGRLVLHAVQGKCRQPWTRAAVDAARGFLLSQDYIAGVGFAAREVKGSYIDGFRHWYNHGKNLVQMHLRTNGLWDDDVEKSAWLKAPSARDGAEVIIHRSARFRGETFPWRDLAEIFSGADLAMVGSEEEHAEWQVEFGPIRHIPTPDLTSLAAVIASSRIFIGNGSAPFALAMGLGKPAILEVCAWSDTCRLDRPNVVALGKGETLTAIALDRLIRASDVPVLPPIEKPRPRPTSG